MRDKFVYRFLMVVLILSSAFAWFIYSVFISQKESSGFL